MNLGDEVGVTIRSAIRDWPRTLRLISLLAAATPLVALLVLLLALLVRPGG